MSFRTSEHRERRDLRVRAMTDDDDDRRPRRTEGLRTQGRSALVVNKVLVATAEELGRVGYAELRVEDVAERAGVNKTTIYRRWPAKPELVIAALRHQRDPGELPDTGSLRGDLLEALRRALAVWSSPIGKGLMRMMQAERAHPEVEAISRELSQEHRRQRVGLVERAIRRGEVPADTDAELLMDLTFSPVFSRLLRRGEAVNEAYMTAIVDFVVAGARAGHAAPRKPRS